MLRLLVFLSLSLSLCRHSIGWLSLSRRRRLEKEGRRSNESRGVVFAPRRVSSSSSICVVPTKVGREETRAALGNDWIDEKKRRPTPHSPSKIARNSIAPLETRANALEPSPRDFRVGNGCVRANRPRLSRCAAVVDGSSTTKRRRSVTGPKSSVPFFFPFFLSFLRKTFGCETFRFDQ